MGLFSKAVDSFFSSKKKAELKVQKEQEIKDFWIKNGKRYEKMLDETFEFIRNYPKDWIDVEELYEQIKKEDEKTNWVDELKSTKETYGLTDIKLDGYDTFYVKDCIEMVYLTLKNEMSEIWLKAASLQIKRNELEKKVNEFDGNGFDEFEDEAQNLLMIDMQNMMAHQKILARIKDFQDTFPSTLKEKNIVAERLGKEGRSLVGTEDKTTKVIAEYEKKKKKMNPNWEPKRFG